MKLSNEKKFEIAVSLLCEIYRQQLITTDEYVQITEKLKIRFSIT